MSIEIQRVSQERKGQDMTETKTYSYSGEYGEFSVDVNTGEIEDALDRDAIWEAASKDFRTQQGIYDEIIYGVLGDDFEYVARFMDFGAAAEFDGRTLAILADNSYLR